MGKDAFGNINNEKSFVVALWLSIIFGIFGVDHFYLGKIGSGILKLLTAGGLGIWWIIDIVTLFRGKTTDKLGNPLEGYSPDARKTNLLILGGLFALSIVFDSLPSDTKVETPVATQSQSSAVQDLPLDSCSTIRNQVNVVSDAFSQGTKSVSQITLLLESAAADWSIESAEYSGSKADWLNKMSELAKKLSSYITTGSPSNGEQIQSQLFNNMNLVGQFCD
jgi:TM2 domain-containing membrane protein YozV